MAQRYHLVKTNASDGPSTKNRHSSESDGRHREREVVIVRDERRHTARWFWVGVVVIVAALLIIWLAGRNGSITHLSQAVNQNSQQLTQEHAQLSGLQAQMSDVRAQLGQIQDEICTFFAQIMQAVRHG
ncbi:hypothetical protein [Alicyclobacillus dauci]|uniref:Uncharacterized protein n=1 Tax=Alicyclobacillus dauci TaxID=1475485 RepID=A0ABY6Z6N7_9BACL|nr:hypothetical protein [Alicyclobacillus dauci]WAH37919.1 hypothetical protein NZD86_05355 [Alicyclobacillus dauci]